MLINKAALQDAALTVYDTTRLTLRAIEWTFAAIITLFGFLLVAIGAVSTLKQEVPLSVLLAVGMGSGVIYFMATELPASELKTRYLQVLRRLDPARYVCWAGLAQSRPYIANLARDLSVIAGVSMVAVGSVIGGIGQLTALPGWYYPSVGLTLLGALVALSASRIFPAAKQERTDDGTHA
ncbi:hypothetical protein JNJ66_03970 [Candidatus Saccharibacteria bacterium]|nr:hypothetical protein [Candidatus Saccharibacteria bacterium]